MVGDSIKKDHRLRKINAVTDEDEWWERNLGSIPLARAILGGPQLHRACELVRGDDPSKPEQLIVTRS